MTPLRPERLLTSKGPLGLVNLNSEVHVLLIDLLINDPDLDVLSGKGNRRERGWGEGEVEEEEEEAGGA